MRTLFGTMLGIMRLLPKLDAETQQNVIRMVEAWGPRLQAAEQGITLVDDATIQAIVEEQRHVSVPSSMVKEGPSAPVVRGTGWAPEPKNEDRTRQFALMDAIVESQVGGPNDTSKLK